MARMRMIKPEFWTDGNIVRLSPFARLLYIGMWNFALCDYGHLPDDPYGLKLQILPADPVNPDELLDELIKLDRVRRIETADGRRFLWARKLSEHQKADPRWVSKCQACRELGKLEPLVEPAGTLFDSPELAETLRNSPQYRKVEGSRRTTTSANTEATSAFQRFWDAYPRRVGKGHAIKAWESAVKLADPDVIIAAAERYADRPGDPKYIKHPSTWLNARSWEDEDPEPPRRRPAAWS